MVGSMMQAIVLSVENDWRCGNIWWSEGVERIQKLLP